jgi:GDP-L-fucose synthase
VIWGSGQPLREFLYVDDLADACAFLMRGYSDDLIINVGSGVETRIADLAQIIAEIVGFKGRLVFDSRHPDGTPRKLLNSAALMKLGWAAGTDLQSGLSKTYLSWIDQNVSSS